MVLVVIGSSGCFGPFVCCFFGWNGGRSRNSVENQQLGGLKLVAAEEARTPVGRQHSPVAARADQLLQPARGQMRIGALEMHRYTLTIHCNLQAMVWELVISGVETKVRRKISS
jgi:hypothetical protein